MGDESEGGGGRLDLFFERSADQLAILGVDGRFRRLNPAWERVLGYPLSAIYAMSLAELLHPDDRARTLAELQRAEKGATTLFENRCRHRDGSYRWLEWSAVRLADDHIFYAVVRDATERRAEQERLRESEAYRTAVQEASTDAIVAFDLEGRVVDLNAAAERMYGYRPEQVLGKSFADFALPPGRRAAFQGDLARYRKAEGRIVDFRVEQVGLRADGSRFPLELTITRLDAGTAEYVAFIRDLTDVKHADEERRSLEEQLRQAQKMEAVGRLAGNVAHDFNNLLEAVAGFIDVAGPALQPGSAARERLERMKKATERAVGLVDQLLAFGRRHPISPAVLDVNASIGELEHILRGLTGDEVQLQLALGSDVVRVKADPAQLQQALVNLVMNAREAMRSGGRLRISTANVELEEANLPPGVDAKPGAYVRISVEDNGVGMSGEVASRALEPFFTTKEAVGASGLGLSTVYGIISQSGGFVRIETAPGRGTIVQLHLPAAPEAAPVAASPEPTETVLLVEDEEAVRQLVRRILEGRGYKVILARHGGEALELIHQTELPIHLLLTDAVMPVLSGPELLRRAIALRPHMKLAIMSGYTDRPAVTGVPFIGKPFTPAELERRVREILDGSTPTPVPSAAR